MSTREEFYYDSRDRENRIHAVKWTPEQEQPVCILQIVHGMAEYVERYDALAEYLAGKGILVTGNDHLGHGKSVGENGVYGYFCKQDPATVAVRDVHRLKKLTQEQYPGVPYLLLGHSMGSFILRNYLCRYGTGIDGAVIMGTGMQPKKLLSFSLGLEKVLAAVQGEKHKSRLLDRLAFGGCNKRIPNAAGRFDWLSTDSVEVEKYEEDPLCGFLFTLNGFRTLFTLIARLHDGDYLAQMPKELPLLLTSGEQDPIGEYGKAVSSLAQFYQVLGIQNVTLKLYPQGRHELVNESFRSQVYEDLAGWVLAVAGKRGEARAEAQERP